ncbi:hypothetical protein ACIF84_30325 [Streptomyces albidoflavus]
MADWSGGQLQDLLAVGCCGGKWEVALVGGSRVHEDSVVGELTVDELTADPALALPDQYGAVEAVSGFLQGFGDALIAAFHFQVPELARVRCEP